MQPYVYRRPGAPKTKKFSIWRLLICLASAFILFRYVSSFARGIMQPKPLEDLSQPINNLVNQYPSATVSVALIDLKSGKQINFGYLGVLPAASVTKLVTAADYLHQVESGKATRSEMMGLYPASFQLQQMVQQSNNDAWNLLSARLGDKQQANYAKSVGLVSFDYDTNKVSAADEARFLQKLYAGDVLNKDDTTLLLAYMQNTNNEDLISAALPDQEVYHKFGLLEGALNDAAIVKNASRPYILVVFTNGPSLSDMSSRSELIHQIAQKIQAFMN